MKIDWVMKTLSETLFTLNNMKRLSLEQKLSSLANHTTLTILFYDNKYLVHIDDSPKVTRSKSISRAISELYKFYNENK